MARPIKEGLDYFPLDTSFYNNRKIRRLRKSQGAKGIGIWIVLLAMIYEGKGYYIVFDENALFDIADVCGVTESAVQEVVNACIHFELIDRKLYEGFHILTSKGIQDQYESVCKQSKRNNNIEDRFKVNSEKTGVFSEETPVNSEETPVNSEFSTQRKEKENKEKKNKVNNISSSTSTNYLTSTSYLESDCVTDVGDDMLPPVPGQKVLDFYQDNFGGILNPLMVQTIQDLAMTYGDDLAIEAFKRSVEAKRPVSYAKRILKDWNFQGVKTPKDIEPLDVAFERAKKQNGKKNYQRESYKENTPEWLKEQQEERKKAILSVVQVEQSTADDLKARIEALSVKGDGNTES